MRIDRVAGSARATRSANQLPAIRICGEGLGGQVPASVLHRVIVESGHQGGLSQRRAYIPSLRPRLPSESEVRFETGFCMRVEKAGNAGFACVRNLPRSYDDERIVTLAAADYESPATAPTLPLVRHVASTGSVRALRWPIYSTLRRFLPAYESGNLYHQRWRIEEVYPSLSSLGNPLGIRSRAGTTSFWLCCRWGLG